MNTCPEVQSYLDTILSEIKFQEAHAEVRQELESHISELIEEGLDKGLPVNVAIENALRRIGNPIEIGQRLHLVHQPKLAWSFICLAIAFLIYNFLLKNSWHLQNFSRHFESLEIEYLGIYFPIILVCFLLGIVLTTWNYQQLSKWGKWIYGLTLLLLVVSIWSRAISFGFDTLFNPQMSGSAIHLYRQQEIARVLAGEPNTIEWVFIIELGITILQIVAPFLLIISLAGTISHQTWKGFKSFLLWIGLLALPITGFYAINCRYSAITFAFAGIALMVASKAKWWQILTSTTVVFSSFYAFYRPISSYPFSYPFSNPRYVSISEYLNEIILRYSIGSYSLVFLALVLCISILLLIKMFLLTRKIKNRRGYLLAFSLTILLGTEFFLNTVGYPGLGLLPIATNDLSYNSYIGRSDVFGSFDSAWWMVRNSAVFGLILSIYRRRTLNLNINHSSSALDYRTTKS